MSRKNRNNNENNNHLFIPETLKEHVFYGLELDEEQKIFRDSIWDDKKLIVLCNSKAGTGKTTIALATANLLVHYGKYNGIIYIASPTQEQKQGFLPGNIEDKNEPYMEPLTEAMTTLGIPENALINNYNMDALKNGDAYIQFVTHTYLRGCNFENKVIIIEEAQNFFFDELKKTLTRIHDNCKTIVIGHDKQCDIYKHSEKSGFNPYLRAFKNAINNGEDRVAICELHTNHRGWVSTFCDDVEL